MVKIVRKKMATGGTFPFIILDTVWNMINKMPICHNYSLSSTAEDKHTI